MELIRHSVGRWIKNGYFSASEKIISGHVDLHWHDFFEIELILSGGGSYCIDGISYKICQGSLFVMSTGSFHSIDFDEGTVLINLMFTPAVAASEYSSVIFSSRPHKALQLCGCELEYIKALLCETITLTSTEGEMHLQYGSSVINTLLGKISLMCGGMSLEADNLPICRALLYITDNFTRGITLAQAARVANYTPNYFGNKFKSYTGKTFKQHITELRFSFASYLLLNTDLSVGEICEKSGFGDLSNFLSAFKKRYGTTPRSFRKRT